MKTLKSLFEHTNYKEYLIEKLIENSIAKKGQRLQLAKHLNCNPSFVTQVLNEHLHFSAEQSIGVSDFLGHTERETKYFLHLVLLQRAGTAKLRKFYEQELAQMRNDNLVVKNRIKTNRGLSAFEQARYYRHWHYAAVHMIVSISTYNTKEAIAKALNLPLPTVGEALEFLTSINLLMRKGTVFLPAEKFIQIGTDSPFLIRHQTNWRLRALQDLDQEKPDHLHYSGVITCAREDIKIIKEILIKAIEEIRQRIKNSPDETLAVYNLDLFKILVTDLPREKRTGS